MCEVLAALPGSAWMPRAGGVSSILRREAACGVQHSDGVRAVGRQESGINLAEERVFEVAERFALANDAPTDSPRPNKQTVRVLEHHGSATHSKSPWSNKDKTPHVGRRRLPMLPAELGRS